MPARLPAECGGTLHLYAQRHPWTHSSSLPDPAQAAPCAQVGRRPSAGTEGAWVRALTGCAARTGRACRHRDSGGCGCNPCESPSGQSGTGACIDRRRYISSYEISKGYGTSAIHIKAPVFPARRDIREPSSPTEFPSPAGGRVRVKVEKIAPSAPRRNPARGVGRVVTQTVPAVPYSMPGAGSSSVRQQDSPTLPPSPQCRDACRSNDRRPMGPHPTGLHNSSSRAPRCIFPQPLRALSSGRTSTPSIMVNRRLSRF